MYAAKSKFGNDVDVFVFLPVVWAGAAIRPFGGVCALFLQLVDPTTFAPTTFAPAFMSKS